MNILPYKYRYSYYTLFLCLEREEVESKKQVDQQKIMLNNQIKISHTSDEEMKHAHNCSDDSSLSDEC